MATKPNLILYVDIVSPFAYLAYYVIRVSPLSTAENIICIIYLEHSVVVSFQLSPILPDRLLCPSVLVCSQRDTQHSPVFAQCSVDYVPVFLGGIIKAVGTTPPINIKNKGPYTAHERRRWAQLFDIPVKEGLPPGFPANTISARQPVYPVKTMFPAKLTDTLDLLFETYFVNHKAVHERTHLQLILSEVLGKENAEAIMQKSTSDEVKKELTAQTQDVISKGSFGLPWYIGMPLRATSVLRHSTEDAATNSGGKTDHFWGFDNIGLVADHLGLDRLEASSAGVRGWRAML
ncbi:MAG: hypothetical protein Q9183_002561 [Haloplaca sp. 2 TL-2023]